MLELVNSADCCASKVPSATGVAPLTSTNARDGLTIQMINCVGKPEPLTVTAARPFEAMLYVPLKLTFDEMVPSCAASSAPALIFPLPSEVNRPTAWKPLNRDAVSPFIPKANPPFSDALLNGAPDCNWALPSPTVAEVVENSRRLLVSTT